MPTINPPTIWRKDEYDSWLKRFIESKRVQLGGTMIIKFVSLFLAILFIGEYSHYWLLFFLIFGVFIQISKSLTLNLLIQADEGEWSHITDYEEEERLMKVYSSRMKVAILSLIIFSIYFGLEIVSFAELTSKNWNGYSSIIMGFLIGIISESVFE